MVMAFCLDNSIGVFMILVTGGAGFIGSNLTDALLELGHTVRVIDNLSSGKLSNLSKALLFGPNFEFIHADITTPGDLLKAAEGVQCIIHLAAQVSVKYSLQQPLCSASSNIMGFINALEAARIKNVPRFIYASSAAVYGQPLSLPLDERSSTMPISPYGLEKLINEQYAKLYQDLHGVSCLGLRFFNVYGPRQDSNSAYAGVISKFIERVATCQPITIFGDGHQTRDFVYVADVAKTCAAAIESAVTGVLCVGTGHSVNLLQLVDGVERAVGDKAEVFHAPQVAGDIVHSSMQPDNLNSELKVLAGIGLQDGLSRLWRYCKDEAKR